MSSLGNRRPFQAFTLLETLISLALISLLMAVVWSLLSLYTRVERQGVVRAVAMQLVRSLHAQLQCDLQTALAPAASGERQQEATAAMQPPKFAGSAQHMQFLGTADSEPWPAVSVLPTEGAGTATVVDAPATGRPSSTSPSQNTGYRSIDYRFYPHPYLALSAISTNTNANTNANGRADLGADGVDRGDSAVSVVGNSSTPFGLVRTAATWPAPEPTAGNETISQIAHTPQDDQVPEITRCEFRYFDGASWLSDWQGNSESGLPVAVEISLDIDTTDEHRQMVDAAGLPSVDSLTTNFSTPISTSIASSDSSAIWVPEYRFVIHLDQVSGSAESGQEQVETFKGFDAGGETFP